MIETTQLLIGAFWMATLAVTSWGAGCLMGFGLAKLTSRPGRRGNDVDELLRRERAIAQAGRPAASPGVPSAAGK